MGFLELACIAILALWLGLRLRVEPYRGRLLVRLLFLAAAAWLAEDTSIRLYHFYVYDPGWTLFVDRVPLMVAFIWPAVIVSGWDLARRFVPAGGVKVALAAAALVYTDASLVEPVAVRAGLWSWTSEGPFGVPIIGILGWAFFAFAAVWLLELERRRRGDGTIAPLLLVGAPVATHLLLLATWWGLLRWIPRDPPEVAMAALAWFASLALTGHVIAHRQGRLVPPGILLTRVPPALFFFGLLLLHGRDVPALMTYAFAFAPPYLALLATRRAHGALPATHP